MAMAAEKALRQVGERGMHPWTGSFYLPAQALLTAAPASAQPGRESEAHGGGGSGEKGRNLL